MPQNAFSFFSFCNKKIRGAGGGGDCLRGNVLSRLIATKVFTMPEGKKVQRMFARIASRYDLANCLLSAGACRHWTRVLADLVARESPQLVVDLATGSGDVALELAKKLPPTTRILGVDFCEEMLDVARGRRAKIAGGDNVEFAFGDCMDLPLDADSVDALTIAYGIRNFENRPRGLREMHRVLRRGGKAFVLEFTQPARAFSPFYFLYLKFVLPLLARVITGDKNAYDYLTSSIEAFPPKEKITQELRAAGFENVRAIGLTFSIVAIHVAEKK
ncbi:MAG: bifunctional demethylmenaquinone methyltransferase/2-methoxy-6-polyprenyl-1,4-benzoquinol methylase UbiE [Opitutae bacterium]|nr:bifunctional demethylmenaquinone methyltransferase/2-methoxy-6-polyprenyl-1,4-benzoquinol methylase UbiE [Opitutae bacterium]